jgi:molybdopterin-guanine dinucleotide biosynthesis protein MobB
MAENSAVKAISFVAKSGTGKTTLVTKVIRELSSRGYRVGAYKASHHFDIDQPGKDSYRMAESGAVLTLINSSEKLALIQSEPTQLGIEALLLRYFSEVDIVLVEGDKSGPLPKIEVCRCQKSDSLLCREAVDSSYVAIASDCSVDVADLGLPLLDLNRPDQVADFIVGTFL